MLRPVPMAHLRVQVPSRDAAAATRCLARAGLLHLIDLAHGQAPGLAAPPGSDELLAAFRDLERRVGQVAERLGCPLRDPDGAALDGAGAGAGADWTAERDLLEARLRPVERAVDEAHRARREARDRRDRARTLAGRARRLREAGFDPARLARLRLASLLVGVARAEDLERLASLLQPAPFAIVPLVADGERWSFVAAVPAWAAERVAAALRVAPCERLPAPSESAAWDASALEREAAEADAAARSLDEQLASLAAEHGALLDELKGRAAVAVLLLQAQSRFVAAGRFTVMSGWVPAADAPSLGALLAAATGGRAVVESDRPERMSEVAAGHLKVPILLRNPLLLRPFQQLVRIYDTPSYREVEPTAFFALSFLAMFGLMFGDVGHGAVLFWAGLLLFRHFPRFLDYGILLMEGGVASMACGALYGSVFGRELLPALWLRPLDDLPRFMAAAIGLGVVLISAGLLLDVVNRWRLGERAGALVGMRGLLGALLYWIALALVARALLPSPWTVPTWALLAFAGAATALIAGRPLIVRLLGGGGAPRGGEPVAGPRWLRALVGSVEVVDALFSFFTNTLAFVRIAAFAAVHAGVLFALFALADTIARVRFGGALSVLALVVGNALVILLEGLTVSVQVLRLEYYEFFTRFFRGGGEEFHPLMLRPPDERGANDDREPKQAKGDRAGRGGRARGAGALGVGAR